MKKNLLLILLFVFGNIFSQKKIAKPIAENPIKTSSSKSVNSKTKQNLSDKKTNYEKILNSDSFSEYKGKIQHPANGTIIKKFGRHPHYKFKNITEENFGITYSIERVSKVKSVFAGIIIKIFEDSNKSKTVIIRHGKFYTIYSNLGTLLVTEKQNVKLGTIIGAVVKDFDGNYSLDFKIMDENQNYLNPELWLEKKY